MPAPNTGLATMPEFMDLPVEVFMSIATRIPKPGFLRTLASLCRMTNDVITPLLYSAVTFKSGQAKEALLFFHVVAENDHLSQLVHSLAIHYCLRRWIRSQDELSTLLCALQTAFPRCLIRMTCLRHLRFEETFAFGATAFHALQSASATLESLSVHVDEQYAAADTPTPEIRLAESNCDLQFPRLTKFNLLDHRLVNNSLIGLLRQLISCNSATLRELGFGPLIEGDMIRRCCSPDLVFESLEKLAINWAMVTKFPLATTTNICRLALYEPIFSRLLEAQDTEEFRLDINMFPLVERLSCHHRLIPSILPNNSPSPRPVHTLIINSMQNQDDVLRSLPFISNSSCPITRLTTCIAQFDFRAFDISAFAGHLASLTYLKIEIAALICNVSPFRTHSMTTHWHSYLRD